MIQTLTSTTRQQNDAALGRAFRVAFGLIACSFLLAFAAVFVAWSQKWDIALTVGGVVFVGGSLAFVTIGATYVVSLLVEMRAADMGRAWVEHEMSAKGLPPAASPLPEPTPVQLRVTSGERAGLIEMTQLHGFEIDDLKWFCRYLANGNAWTEARLENMPLPSGVVLGRDREGSPYRRLMGLCVSTGIISARGGNGNKTGTLAITDAGEMLERLRG